MGVRSESESDAIAFIHAPDAEPWAKFLQTKLGGSDYSIRVSSHQPLQQHIPELVSSTQTCAVLVSPSLLDEDHRSFWTQCVELFHNRTVVLFLGVSLQDMKDSLESPVWTRVQMQRCLEVDGSKEAVMSALVKLIEAYESTGCSHSDSGHDADSLQEEEGTKGYQDDEDIYDYPPPPRQQNGILQVLPTVLYEHSTMEVLILTVRDVEGTVTMVTETRSHAPSRHIQLEKVTSSAYIAKIPCNLQGKVDLALIAGEHTIGRASIFVHSRLAQLRHILESETSPLLLLCTALGVSDARADTAAERADALLAKRLTEGSYPADLLKLLCSEDLTGSGEREDSQWPTLLHFAAEFNLTRVCEELLKFPGMILAACTENKTNQFPCQLAEKNGYRALQKRLVQYVEDTRLRRSAADSGISFSENLPPPPPERHRSSSFHHYYVNAPPEDDNEDTFDENDPYVEMMKLQTFDDDVYVDMTKLTSQRTSPVEMLPVLPEKTLVVSNELLPPLPPACLSRLMGNYSKPRSFSEGCVKTPYARQPSEAIIAEEESESSDPPPLHPKISRAKSSVCEYASSVISLPSQRRPDSGSSEGSDAKESTSRPASEVGATGGADTDGQEAPESAPRNPDNQAGSRPSSSGSLASDGEESTAKQATNPDDTPVLRGKETKRSKSVHDKISHFFKKMKISSRRHASDGDLAAIAKGQKKTVVYTRHSAMSTCSDPSGYNSSSNHAVLRDSSLRDSGAVCDPPGSPVLLRSSSKDGRPPKNSGKRNGTSMQRRLSVRVQRARNEELGEMPNLPAHSSAEGRETFVSFIK